MQIAELEYQLEDSVPTQRTLRLRVGASDVSLFMDRAAGKLRKDVSVPGFRKGRGPLPLIRKHFAEQIGAMAFDELRRAAVDQALKQLKAEDQPFIPPEAVDQQKLKLRYGKPLEFAVRCLVDPAGMGKNPEQPQDQFNPLGQLHTRQSAGLPLGVPAGPKLPVPPAASAALSLPMVPD